MATTTNTSNSNSKTLIDQKQVDKNISSRMTKNKIFKGIFLACTLIGLIVLAALLVDTLIKGAGHLTPSFLLTFHLPHHQWQGLKVH